MSESTYKYCSLNLSDARYDYCYDSATDEVSTQLFPGIPIHKVILNCGYYLTHDQVKKIIKYKLGITSNLQQEGVF